MENRGRKLITLDDLPPNWREIIIEKMGEGHSKEYIASIFGVSFRTIYNLIEREPEFAEAFEIGKARALKWWEENGLAGLWEAPKQKKINEKMYLLQFRNRFPELYVSERAAVEVRDKDGSTITVRFASETDTIS